MRALHECGFVECYDGLHLQGLNWVLRKLPWHPSSCEASTFIRDEVEMHARHENIMPQLSAGEVPEDGDTEDRGRQTVAWF